MDAINVVLVTWPNHPKRIEYFYRTLAALKKHLTASRHELRWWCSAESERDPKSTWHGDELAAVCQEAGITLVWKDPPASLGAAMNAALRLGDAPTIFLVQDDYELLHPLDLSPGAEWLDRHRDAALLRYSYYCHPQHGTKFLPGEMDGFRVVDVNAHWPYGDDCHLRRRDSIERTGWYIEGGRHGCSEGDFLFRLVAQKALIGAADKCYFGHFGEVAAVPVDQEYRERAVSR